MNEKKRYGIISLILFIVSIIILTVVDRTNNINLSLTIQLIMILYLSKMTYGCILYVKKLYKKQRYSYSIVLNIGLALFFIINIMRQINLLIINWTSSDIIELYNNTLNSFSYFAILVLPCIIILSIYSMITNIILIKKEGFTYSNLFGIFFGVTTIISTFCGQIIFEAVQKLNLSESQFFIKKFIDVSLNATLSYFYCLILATLYCNVMAAKHIPKFDKDFIIILGSQIKKDGSLTPLLKGRADKAISFAQNQKAKDNRSIIFIPSGGQGNDEIISEAEAIKRYLIENGIEKKDIILEDKSTNTLENLKYSKKIIDNINKNGKIIFSTTNYHVFRSGVIANDEGIDCEGIGSKTKWYFYTNALIREFIANIASQGKKHIALIIIINIILLNLILIGYMNNLINN